MRIGDYEILGSLGRGGSGEVFRARSREGASVALKLLNRVDADTVAHFDRERRLLATLGESQGFVPLIDAGVSPQGPWLCMPFFPGGTLERRLARGALSLEDSLSIGRALAGALGRAHAQGIVHRDLKPANILFTETGTPLVADLGIAKHFARGVPGASQSQSLSRTGELRGTPGYMPPEQMQNSKAVTPASDVFALGAILYECLAGTPAFVSTDGTVLSLLARTAEGEVTPLLDVRPDAPRWLATVVHRALDPEPAERFADAAGLARALEGERQREPGPARPRAAVASLGLALVGAVGFFALPRGSTVPPTSATSPLPANPGAPSPGPRTPTPPPSTTPGVVDDSSPSELLDPDRQRAKALAFEPQNKPALALAAWYRLLDSAPPVVERRLEAMKHVRDLIALVPPITDPARASVWRTKVLIAPRTQFSWTDARTVVHALDLVLPDSDRADLLSALEAWRSEVTRLTRGQVRLELDVEDLPQPITTLSEMNPEVGPNCYTPYPQNLPVDVRETVPRGRYDSILVCEYMGGDEGRIPRAGPVWFMGNSGEWANGYGMLTFYSGELRQDPAVNLVRQWLHQVRAAFQNFHGLPPVFASASGPVHEAQGCDCPDAPRAPTELAEHLAHEHVTDHMWRECSPRKVWLTPWSAGDVHVWRVAGPYPYGGGLEGAINTTSAAEDLDNFSLAPTERLEGLRRELDLKVAFPSQTQPRYVLLMTWFKLPIARKVIFEIGSAEGHRALVDGEIVHTDFKGGGDLNASSVAAQLDAGWHRLFLKVATLHTSFKVMTRLRGADGLPIPGIELDADHARK